MAPSRASNAQLAAAQATASSLLQTRMQLHHGSVASAYYLRILPEAQDHVSARCLPGLLEETGEVFKKKI